MINFEYIKEYLTIRATEHLYVACNIKQEVEEVYKEWKSRVEESTCIFCDEIRIKVKLITDIVHDNIVRAYWVFEQTEIPFGFTWAGEISQYKSLREIKTFS